MVRLYDFRRKEVINISDGCRLGCVYDAIINEDDGTVDALIIPGTGKFLGIFGKDNEHIIPWSDIKRIGDDIVLVDMDLRTTRRR